MAAAKIQDLSEWQSRMDRALNAFFAAINAPLPAAEAVKRDQVIRGLEHEGRMRGFLTGDGVHG